MESDINHSRGGNVRTLFSGRSILRCVQVIQNYKVKKQLEISSRAKNVHVKPHEPMKSEK